jgi:hypothetical protein
LPTLLSLVILSRQSHDEIVFLLQQQIHELKNQNRELAHERNFYRDQFLKKEIKQTFPAVPAPVVVESPPVVLTDEEKRKSFRLNRSDWSIDDRELFEDYWVTPNRAKHMPDDEMDWYYHQKFGNTMPILAFTQQD